MSWIIRLKHVRIYVTLSAPQLFCGDQWFVTTFSWAGGSGLYGMGCIIYIALK